MTDHLHPKKFEELDTVFCILYDTMILYHKLSSEDIIQYILEIKYHQKEIDLLDKYAKYIEFAIHHIRLIGILIDYDSARDRFFDHVLNNSFDAIL